MVSTHVVSREQSQRGGPSRDETERCVESLVFPVFQIRRGTLRPKQELVPWKSCDDEEDAYDDEHLAHCEFPRTTSSAVHGMAKSARNVRAARAMSHQRIFFRLVSATYFSTSCRRRGGGAWMATHR